MNENQKAFSLDALIVGAGFAGIYMLHKLREMGFSAKVVDAAAGVGGTWYWNRYPGARCDVESMFYSYSFDHELEQDWEWTERYPAQPEILSYINHVADRFDLRPDIQLETRVNSAVYDETNATWLVTTDDTAGDEIFSAQFFIMATGCLSAANTPDFEGLDSFTGRTFHTGRWPHEKVDFKGRRVGVIGTGSSGVQIIPEIAKQAEHLTVFQRTATYVVEAFNRPLGHAERTDNRDNVSLVSLGEGGVKRITPTCLVAKTAEFQIDDLVLATGFDAMTGAISRVHIQGRDNLALRTAWEAGPRTYLGLMTHGFPNFFIITGPGSPSVLTNMVPTIEQHVEWIAECIDYLREQDLKEIEADLNAQNEWVEQGNELATKTLRYSCSSWYLGANVPGKPRVFMPYIGGMPAYREKCAAVAAAEYEGFRTGEPHAR